MTVVGYVTGAMLGLAGALVLLRLARGPSLLDRVVAMDVLLAVTAGSIGVFAAVRGDSSAVPVIVVASLLSFVGSVGISRFVVRERIRDEDAGPVRDDLR